MPKIFICYRREDSKWPAHWIYDDLVDHFGSESIVFDIDTIPLGADFREYLNEEVSRCDIFLTVIGDRWLEILKQRLDQPNDFVRIEIQAALEREIPVLPILVGEKPVPNENDLPSELANLSYKQAAEVRAGADLHSHLKRLVDGLDRLISKLKADEERRLKEVHEAERKAEDAKAKAEAKTKAKRRARTNSIGMEFVLIPAGSFMMGRRLSPEEEEREFLRPPVDEHPPHKVTISKPFYLQSTQVTQEQWKKVMEDNPSRFKDCGDDCPVERISWHDAKNFIFKLNHMEGTNKYRLPTEAEWEYACRAGTTTEFFFGDDADKLEDYAWYDHNSESNTHPVGQKKTNPWGLYDTYGNVWEWVQDWLGTYPSNPVVDPKGPLTGRDRVLRGGSWESMMWMDKRVRSAARNRYDPVFRSKINGFRVAQDF